MSQYKELADKLQMRTSSSYADLHEACDEAAAILRSLDAQPVAWCALMPNGKIAYFDGRPMVMPGPVGNEHHTTPLYAAPVAAQPQQAKREPLSDAEIHDISAAVYCGLDREYQDFKIEFARAIEAAHGIKD